MMQKSKAYFKSRVIVIHCNGGKHRSPAMTGALLVFFGHLTVSQAINSLDIHPSFNSFLWNVEKLRGGSQGRMKKR